MRYALPLLECKENCAFPGYGFGGSIAREIRGGEVCSIFSRDRGTMLRASSSITQLFHKLAASATGESSIPVTYPNTWLSARGIDVAYRKEETLRIFYALYGHIGSFRIFHSGADRREALSDGFFGHNLCGLIFSRVILSEVVFRLFALTHGVGRGATPYKSRERWCWVWGSFGFEISFES